MDLYLSAIPPLNFDSVARSHGWIQLPPLDYTRDGERGIPTLITVLRFERPDEPPLIAEVTIRPAAEDAEKPGVVVTTDVPRIPVIVETLKKRVTWMLGLEQDLSDFFELAHGEPRLAHVEPQAQGRILRSPTLFEDVVKTILTTNTSWSGTVRMIEALVNQLGSPLPGDRDRRAFPTPAQIAAVDEIFLREKTKLGYRAPRIINLARDVAAGNLDLEVLKDPSLESSEVREALRAIKGVGSYAAASLMTMLGHFGDIPVDSWARTQVSRFWHNGESVTQDQVREAFAAWGDWQALVYWFWNWDKAPDQE